VALAEWVLRDRPEWDRERIVAATSGSQTLHVPLARPTRVIFFYTTAVVTPGDGLIRFAEDIYRHDERLERALAARRTRPASDASGIDVHEVGGRVVAED
jgi:murein L,D-transpeptidase YcbB/YkuD